MRRRYDRNFVQNHLLFMVCLELARMWLKIDFMGAFLCDGFARVGLKCGITDEILTRLDWNFYDLQIWDSYHRNYKSNQLKSLSVKCLEMLYRWVLKEYKELLSVECPA